jgi:thiamine pyrophosphokinase
VALHRTAIDPRNLNLDNASGGSVDIEQPTSQRTIIFAGGDILTKPSPDPRAFVIAADSGYDHAVGLGHTVDLLVGDLDSVSAEGLTDAEAAGVAIDRHPISKDATDMELALDVATNRGASSIDIFGGEGGRIDHLLGVATGLTETTWSGIDLTWHTATGTIRPLVDGGHIHVDEAEGTVISLIVVSDSVGVTTQGLRWQLSGEMLHRGTSRGLSNEIVRTPASVSLDDGAILVVTDSGLRS